MTLSSGKAVLVLTEKKLVALSAVVELAVKHGVVDEDVIALKDELNDLIDEVAKEANE
jgi:hypothetical protein